LALQDETPFFRWNLPAAEPLGRHNGLAAEAEEMRRGLHEALVGAIQAAAKTQRADMDADSAVQMLTEQARRHLYRKRRRDEEWDLRGIEKWAEAAEISLSTSQWQRSEGADEETDTLSDQLNVVREQIQERLKRVIRNRPRPT